MIFAAIFFVFSSVFFSPHLCAQAANQDLLPLDFTKIGPFPVEAQLRLRVRFWVDVYAKYSRFDMVLHDAKYPHIIFGVVSTRSIRMNPALSAAQKAQEVRRLVEEQRKRVSKILQTLHEKEAAVVSGDYELSEAESAVFRQYREIKEPDRFLKVVQEDRRIRGQYGLKESFIEGLYESGRYLPGMKVIATRLGLPAEIVYLPFLESGFDQRALSKVGASGLWQIMPSTGKFFLRIDDAVDERNDPMKAAEGAALLMRDNFAALEEWPLAITAYNHGRSGVARAVKSTASTSLAKIIESYNGPNFGFASANFYSAFVAALHVAKNAEAYFGAIERAEPMEFEEFVMPDYLDVRELARHTGIELETLKAYNPGLKPEVWLGKKLLPVGYTLRIPLTKREDFLARYQSIPKELRMSKQLGLNAEGDLPQSKSPPDESIL